MFQQPPVPVNNHLSPGPKQDQLIPALEGILVNTVEANTNPEKPAAKALPPLARHKYAHAGSAKQTPTNQRPIQQRSKNFPFSPRTVMLHENLKYSQIVFLFLKLAMSVRTDIASHKSLSPSIIIISDLSTLRLSHAYCFPILLFCTILHISSNCSSISFTSLNWVRARTKLCSGYAVLKYPSPWR